MTTDIPGAPAAEKQLVSTAERVVPSLAFGLAALSGPVGAILIQQFFNSMRTAETAGYQTFFGGVARIDMIMGGILSAAAFLGFAAVVASLARLFIPRKRCSPPGSLLFLSGLLSLVPPVLVLYSLRIAADVVTAGSQGGVSAVAQTIITILYAATGLAVLIIIGLIIFSFLSFQARPGRRYVTLSGLVIAEILIVVLAVEFFLEAGAMQSLGMNR